MTSALPRFLVDDLVTRALHEDLEGEDLTTMATVKESARAIGYARAKSPLTVSGGQLYQRAFELVSTELEVTTLVDDGKAVEPGTVIWEVRGPTRGLLMAERTALNFVQRMSGIATLARRYVGAVAEGAKTRIVDTRKTTPGLRAVERYAVRCGGAYNHRDTLSSAVLIKDNHIEAAGGIAAAITRARNYAPHTCRIEIEVESLAGLDEALNTHADIVMLDNFDPEEITEAVRRVHAQGESRGGTRALVEVSGGITLERIGELSRAGVDVISCGALTHSAQAADISLRIEAHKESRC